MHPSATVNFLRCSLPAVLCLLPFGASADPANPNRGLWVGEVTVINANEVSIPLDANNVPIAPNPNIPTPTADQAHLRLILHVNGAGQVSLLRDVAILNRVAGSTSSDGTQIVDLTKNAAALNPTSVATLTSDSDAALVTDEQLYGEFPPQPAFRIASAVFDFGDRKATDGVNAVVDAAAQAAGQSATTTSNEASVRQTALDAANPVVVNADVAVSFNQFLISSLNSAKVTAIAAASNPQTEATAVRALAVTLQGKSFYGDSRAVKMVDAIVAAVQATVAALDLKVAQNTAAAYADLADNYGRFIAGKSFGDMISGAASAAATAAATTGATAQSIENAVGNHTNVVAARAEGLRLKVPAYSDTRFDDAINLVIGAINTSAIAALPATATQKETIQAAADAAGRAALANSVARYSVSPENPTSEYNQFVASALFKGSATTAATAAASAALFEKRNNALYDLTSLQRAAKLGAINALRDVYLQAARTMRNELDLLPPASGGGGFGPGKGDPRFVSTIKPTDPALGAEALSGTIFLPADHPTNPFRHRRHPDHAIGFDVTRNIRLDFDGLPTDGLARAGFGVQRITGTYREEILGLHKPLGPAPATQPVGLKVEGKFQLNRISLIDTLNAR